MRLVELELLAILLLTPLGQLGRIPFILENTYIYPNDLLIPLVLVTWLIYRLTIRRTLFLPKLTWPILIVLVVSGISLLAAKSQLSNQEFIVSSLYLVRLVLYLSLYFITWDVVRERKNWHFWKVALLVTAFLVALTGFVQFVLVPDFSFAAQYGWDPHQGRLLGTFFDPNFIGGFLSLALALTLSILGRETRYKWTLTTLAVTLFVAIILTFSRSSYLALAGVILVIGIFRSRWLLILGVIAFASALVLVPRIQERLTEGIDPGESASFRLTSWGNALSVWETSPVIGVGYNTYRYAQDRLGLVPLEQSGNAGAGSDSSALFILATTGVVGVAAWSYLILAMIRLSWRNMRRGGQFGLAILAGGAALALHSQFVNSFFFIWIMAWWWMTVGLMEAETDG